MSETDDPRMHGRLGRLFAALVGTDDDDDPARAEKDGAAGGFDLDELARSLASASDPAGVLRAFAAGVQERSSLAEIGQGEAPSGLELYLAERLIEAGVLASDAAPLPALRVVRPRTSDLFYLRVEDEELPWLSKVRLIRVEAALNAALLASRTLPEGGASATLEEVVRCEQRTCRSIVAQAPSVAARREGTALGEWDVREAISFGIESFRLPYRLSARFRVNVAAGVAAFEVDLVPPRAWASTVYVDTGHRGRHFPDATPRRNRLQPQDGRSSRRVRACRGASALCRLGGRRRGHGLLARLLLLVLPHAPPARGRGPLGRVRPGRAHARGRRHDRRRQPRALRGTPGLLPRRRALLPGATL